MTVITRDSKKASSRLSSSSSQIMVPTEESHIKVGILIKPLAEGSTSAIRVCDKTIVTVETKKKVLVHNYTTHI